MTSTSLDRTLAAPLGDYLITRNGAQLRLRPVLPEDATVLADFLARLSTEDRRFRFLDTRKPAPADIAALVEVDHRRTEHLLAFDTATGELAASLMLVADDALTSAEVAIAVASEWKQHGIGWALLRHARKVAAARGLSRLICVADRADHEALEIERSQGFRARPFQGDPTLLVLEAEIA